MVGKKFMLVDDDIDDTELFTEAVVSVDASIRCLNAGDGAEALEKLYSKEVNKPDLIFLDINMPVMNGWQFLSRIKDDAELRGIPVIMYSTSSRASDFREALASGALCFFTKPNSFGTLKNVLRIVLDHMHNDDLDKVCDAIHQSFKYKRN